MVNLTKILGILILLVMASSFAMAVTSDSNAQTAEVRDDSSVFRANADANDSIREAVAERREVRETMVLRRKFMFNNRQLECGDDDSTARERVLCRLRARHAENELYYVPEECRKLNGTAQERCFAVYDKFQNCREFRIGAHRDACFVAKIGLPVNVTKVREAKQRCDSADNKSACIEDLREKAFLFARAKLYDLQEKAQRWQTIRGVSEDAVANFTMVIDQRKVEFDAATTVAAKIAVLQQAQRDYVEFVHSVNGSSARVTENATVASTENN